MQNHYAHFSKSALCYNDFTMAGIVEGERPNPVALHLIHRPKDGVLESSPQTYLAFYPELVQKVLKEARPDNNITWVST
ncbi:MAG TPA: hypothetical protein VEP90_27240 [Methylomirabilota bacterium]|nr:hypothetical protein [Methylomirabilota bacterium]